MFVYVCMYACMHLLHGNLNSVSKTFMYVCICVCVCVVILRICMYVCDLRICTMFVCNYVCMCVG